MVIIPERPRYHGQSAPTIMVLAISALGDFVLTIPLIIEINKVLPDCSVTIVCLRPEVAAFAKDTLLADRVVSLPPRSRKLPIQALIALRQIRAIGADLALQTISSHGTFGNLLMGASSAAIRCGFNNGRFKRCLTHLVPISRGRHRISLNLDLLRRLGYHDVQDPQGRFLPEASTMSRTDQDEVAALTSDAAFVVISIGSDPKLFFKRWSNEKWAQLVKRLDQDSITCVFIGSRGERQAIDELIKRSNCAALNLAGKTSLPDLVVLIEKSVAVVGTDGMALHLASAIDKPVIGIFGPTDPSEVGPYGEGKHIVNLNLPCSPCYNNLSVGRTIACTTYECIGYVTVEMVYLKIKTSLQRLI